MESITLRPRRMRVFLDHAVGGALGLLAVWVVLFLWTSRPVPFAVATVIAWIVGSVWAAGGQVDRGTIRVTEDTIAGPGRFLGDVFLHKPPEGFSVRSNWFDRLNGVVWIATASDRIRVRRRWYDPSELQRLFDAIGLPPGSEQFGTS